MSVEWDEELIAGLESGLHNCGSDECQERQRAVRLARAEHTARLEAEAERDALVERVDRLAPVVTAVLAWINDEAVGHEEASSGYRQAAWDVRRVVLNADAAILSDQEGR